MGRVAVVGYPHETNLGLAAAWREAGIDSRLVAPPDAVRQLAPGDVAVGRLDVLETLDGVELGLSVLERLELEGVTVLNRAPSLLAAHDKLLTEECLAAAGLPHPPTRHSESAERIRDLPLPLVVKPRFGSWGRDVFRCRTEEEREACLAVASSRGWFRTGGALVQELLPAQGFDLRLILANGELVGAVERVAKPGEWRTNTSLGGSLRPAMVSSEARALGIAAAAAIGADLVGVDVLPADGELTVLELNGAVEFDERYSLPGSNIYAAAAEALGLTPARLAAV
jgi:ribosomal protein S6--L-glutamate ligase